MHLLLEETKIGIMQHEFLFDDEANSGRRICEGCTISLNDFKYKVISLSKNTDENFPGYNAQIKII